jgi:hypothetical protein
MPLILLERGVIIKGLTQMKKFLVCVAILIATPAAADQNASHMDASGLPKGFSCDAPGVANIVIPDLFKQNPIAQKFGVEVTSIQMLSHNDSGCIVAVYVNHGDIGINYNFRYSADGVATLDIMLKK